MEKYKFIEPWYSIDEYSASNKTAMEQEVKNEIPKGHALYGEELHVIARRDDEDTVLYQIGDSVRVAIVHLTWSGKTESIGFPVTTILKDVGEFIETVMKQDVENH